MDAPKTYRQKGDKKPVKKICYVTTVSGTLRSFVLPVAKYLAEHTDWEIYMMANSDPDFEKTLPESIHFIPVPMARGISIGGIKAMLKMRKIFKREKFDLVQYSTPNAALYASMAAKAARVPVRLYCQWGMAYVGMHGLKRKIFKFIERQVCKMSTWIEPDSNSNLNFAIKEGLYKADKACVIGNGSACGVNLNKFNIAKKEEYRKKIREEYNIPQDAFVYGFVGRITRDKGINELFTAFKKIYEENQTARLLMVGSIENEEVLNSNLLAWSRNCKNVVFVGSTNVVEQYLSAIDCYVLPSYREGFGMGTIEAEAMGVPVIVTEIPGPIDAMLPNITGKLVPKADAEALYNAMKEIPSDDLLSFGENGRSFAEENFEQQKLCQLIFEDRKRLLGK